MVFQYHAEAVHYHSNPKYEYMSFVIPHIYVNTQNTHLKSNHRHHYTFVIDLRFSLVIGLKLRMLIHIYSIKWDRSSDILCSQLYIRITISYMCSISYNIVIIYRTEIILLLQEFMIPFTHPIYSIRMLVSPSLFLCCSGAQFCNFAPHIGEMLILEKHI